MDADKTFIRDFTKGSVPGSLLVFTLPFMASNACQVLYSVVDMVIVGRFMGGTGISAISLGSQILNFLTMMHVGYCNGGQIFVAQLIGAKLQKELNGAIGTLFSSALLLGLIFSCCAVLLRVPLLRLLNTPAESFDMTINYLTICGVGLVFTSGYNMVSSVLRGMGDSKYPFLFITLAAALNLILDMLFTAYFGWGVPGIAAATALAQAVSFLLSMILLYRRRSAFPFDFKRASWKIRWIYFKPIIKQGIPLAINSSAIHISALYVNSLINQIGVAASATFGIGIKIDDLCTKISIGIRYAAAPMIAQNYAAHNLPRTKSIVYWSWIFAGIFHCAFVAIYLLFGQRAFALFTNDTDVLKLAPIFISAIIWTFFPLAFTRGSYALIQGIGNAPLNMFFGILDGILLRAGLSYGLGITAGYGFYGFVLGYGLAPLGLAVPGILYFFSGVWEKRGTLVDEL
jgi:putative MATE family efflux protein